MNATSFADQLFLSLLQRFDFCDLNLAESNRKIEKIKFFDDEKAEAKS
jgi:hypothetical protein